MFSSISQMKRLIVGFLNRFFGILKSRSLDNFNNLTIIEVIAPTMTALHIFN
jgi:hypothetical protein